MRKNKVFIINLIIIFVMLFSTTCFGANYTIDLYEGETSEEIESDSTTYSEPDSSIASMNATLGGEPVTVYKAGDQELDSARYTFTRNGNNNTSYTISANGVYLYLGNNQVNNGYFSRNITVTDSGDGFIFNYRNRYLRYNNGFTSNNSTVNNVMYLYEKDSSGEGDGNGIPGYNRVNNITPGNEYLIVYPNGDNYYILYPSTSSYTKLLTEETESEPSKYTFTGVKSGTTTATIGDDTYTINVYKNLDNNIDKEIMVRRGSSYTIQTNMTGLTYSSMDSNIATVDQNGVVTGVANGETYIVATTQNGEMYKIPTEVYNTGYDTAITIDTDEHTKVYHSTNYSTSLIQAQNGETITFIQPAGTYKIFNIFGVPDEGYALAQVTGIMTAITDETASEIRNGRGSTGFVAGHIENGTVPRNTIANGVEAAHNLGAEGFNGYTRRENQTGNFAQTFQLRSEKLPTISSSIYSVNGTLYEEGMNIKPGDTVVYKVNVLKDEAGQYLNIENGSLSASLSNTTYIGTAPEGNGSANSISINATSTYDNNFYFQYTVPENAEGKIDNTFSLNYVTYVNANIHDNVSYKTNRTLTSNSEFEITSPEYEIKFSNTVYGNAGDQDKYFKYRVDIDVEDGEEFTILGQDATVEYDGQTINTSNKYRSGYVNYIYLKHGQEATIVVKSLKNKDYIDKIYTITQIDGDDYETRVSNVVNKTAGPYQLQDDASTVGFVNFKEVAPNTFVNITYIPFVWLGIISLLGLLFIIVRHKKQNL